jgi:preprotein translocase subunit SecA
MEKVEQLYRKREVEYPVDFALQITTLMARNSFQEAAANLVAWANARFRMGWDASVFKKTPDVVRSELIAESEKFVSEGRMEKEIEAGLKCTTDEQLEKHLQERFNLPLPENMRHLAADERPDKIRARIENILRPELLQLERGILLETLDTAWKDHLYAMDQLRDSINFRAFSQQDPRIEYKKEGSHLFNGMMESVRARVTEYVFKARIQMPGMGGGPRPMAAPMARPMAAPMMSSGITGPGITGPGLDSGTV